MFIEDGEDRTCAERDNRSEAHASPFPLLHIFLNFSPSRTLLALLFVLLSKVLRGFTILLPRVKTGMECIGTRGRGGGRQTHGEATRGATKESVGGSGVVRG